MQPSNLHLVSFVFLLSDATLRTNSGGKKVKIQMFKRVLNLKTFHLHKHIRSTV